MTWRKPLGSAIQVPRCVNARLKFLICTGYRSWILTKKLATQEQQEIRSLSRSTVTVVVDDASDSKLVFRLFSFGHYFISSSSMKTWTPLPWQLLLPPPPHYLTSDQQHFISKKRKSSEASVLQRADFLGKYLKSFSTAFGFFPGPKRVESLTSASGHSKRTMTLNS